MTTCWICRGDALDKEGRTIEVPSGEIFVHDTCLIELASVVREASVVSGTPAPGSRLGTVLRSINGEPMLVYRSFPTEQTPILVYLAFFDRPVPLLQIYDWLRRNELKIKNPSLAVLRLGEKGLVTTIKQGEGRQAIITDAGKAAVNEFLDSLDSV